MKSTSHGALGRLTRNSRSTLSSGNGAFVSLTVVMVFPLRRTPAIPHGCSQPFQGALGDYDAFAPQTVPGPSPSRGQGLTLAVWIKASISDMADPCPNFVTPPSPGRTLAAIGKTGSVLVVRGGGRRPH